MVKYFLSTIILFIVSFRFTIAQVNNVRARVIDREVVITYDLLSPDSFQEFDVDIRCSYAPEKELEGLRGDVGTGILTGLNRQATWEVEKDYQGINADVYFEVIAKSQSSSGPAESAGKFQIFAEYPAIPEGGYEMFYSNIAKKIRYPSEAVKSGIEGKVLLQFIIEFDGSLSNVNVLQDICDGCGEAAIASVKDTRWKPAEHEGRQVRQQIVVPVMFKIEGSVSNVKKQEGPPKAKKNKSETAEAKEEEVMLNPDQKALPRGGYETFFRNLGANIKPPMDFAESQVKMVVQVIVEQNGRLSNIKFIQGTDFRIEDEVKRLLRDSRWTAAEHQGIKVRHQVTFPLNLRLE